MLAVLLTGCSGGSPPPPTLEGESVVEPGPTCVPAPAVSTPPLPGLELPAGAVLTGGSTAGGQVLTSGRVALDVDATLAFFREAVSRAGYVVQRDEDEGRGGILELFGAAGSGTVVVAQAACARGESAFTVRLQSAS